MSSLRLINGRWTPRSSPLRIGHHSLPSSTFDTLATLPASASLQAPVASPGTREGSPNAAAIPLSVQGGKGGKRYLGVELPSKPAPPGPEECCQSGCAICVYDVYMDETEEYHSSLANARKAILHKINSQGLVVKDSDWPAELGEMEQTSDKGVDPKVLAERELERARKGLDPALRAFLEMEARMKKKAEERKAAAEAEKAAT